MIETTPRTLEELLQFKNLELLLEVTYLNLARAISVVREQLHLQPGQPLQLVCVYADGAIMENMAHDLQRLHPNFNLHIVAKPLSRLVINSLAIGPNRDERWSRENANSAMTDIMLKDNRLGVFDPKLPTLWVDSSFAFSLVQLFNTLFKTAPIGNPAYFYSVNYVNTDNIVPGRFAQVLSPPSLLRNWDDADYIDTFSVEGLLRLPIEKSTLAFDDAEPQATLHFSEERNQSSAYYAATRWCVGPEQEARRQFLLQQSLSAETFAEAHSELYTDQQSS